MALQSRYVDAIFARMLVRYGTAWTGKWKGIDPDAVKADWAEHLDGLTRNAIRYALEYLPAEFPPTAAQFKALCCARPEPEQRRLAAPKADPAKVSAEIERMRSMQTERSRLQWAYDLQEREKRGDNLTPSQRIAWRDAIAHSAPVNCLGGSFSNIDIDRLPPGMREEAISHANRRASR